MQMRLGRMQAYSHPHRVRGNQRTLRRDSRRDAISRPFENDEERIAFGLNLATAMRGNCFSQEATMLRTEVTVSGAVTPREHEPSMSLKSKVTVPCGRPAAPIQARS